MLCDFFLSDICTRKVKQSIKALSLVIHLPDRRSQSCKTVMMIVKVILILSLATLSMARCRGIRCVFKSEETRWKTPLILTTIVIVIVIAILYCHCHHPLLVIVLKRNYIPWSTNTKLTSLQFCSPWQFHQVLWQPASLLSPWDLWLSP